MWQASVNPSSTNPSNANHCSIYSRVRGNSLDLQSSEVIAGETVTITAEIENSGGSEGTYNAVLTIDGATVETKEVMLTPGTSKTVTFSLVKDEAGTYQVGIGGLTSSLTVKQKLVIKEVELKYDDGEVRDYLSAGPGGGYLIGFSLPSIPFTIEKVRIFGLLGGTDWEDKIFTVAIWDKDYKLQHLEDNLPVTMFALDSPGWIEVSIPDVEVNEEFYIHVYTGTGRGRGIHIGAEDSVVNEHSDLTRKMGAHFMILTEWPFSADFWFGDKSKVNWMIRVVGTFAEN